MIRPKGSDSQNRILKIQTKVHSGSRMLVALPGGDFSAPHSPRHRFSVGGDPGANTLNTNSELESRSEKSFLHLARFATLYLH